VFVSVFVYPVTGLTKTDSNTMLLAKQDKQKLTQTLLHVIQDRQKLIQTLLHVIQDRQKLIKTLLVFVYPV
jgi:hypothetical protein